MGRILDLSTAMVLLDDVVQVFEERSLVRLGSSRSSRISAAGSMRRSIAVEGDRVRRQTFVPDRLLEEGLCCGYIFVSC